MITFNDDETKANNLIIKIKRGYKPTRLTFNFSFLTKDKQYNLSGKNVDKAIKAKLIDKIIFLSSEDKVAVLNYEKYQGLEKLDESEVTLRKHSEFVTSNRDNFCGEGYWIFRLSDKGRVIGKMIDTTFYILSIDTRFKQYSHGN